MKRSISPLCLVWCATACGFASSAIAAESAPGALALPFASNAQTATLHIQPVGDDVLAQQTGKYANASMISGFVLNLLSEWQLPNGALAVAQGSLSVANNAANQLSAQVSTLAKVLNGNGSYSSGATPNAIAAGGQTISVNGISQVTQVAGNYNGGTNTATIDFDSGAPTNLLPGGTSNPTAYASNLTGTITAGISFSNNGIALALQTPAGLATQTITPSAAQQAGAIAQLLQIAGNRQLVTNQLQLQLQTTQMSTATIRQLGVLQALQNSVAPGR